MDANTKVPSGFEVDADDITEGYSVQNLEDVSIEGNMLRVRQAELVILKEEEKFGKLGRAPDGRIAPSLQAQTEWTALELSRDNHRPITEASVTDNFFALHADKSDIGIAERPIQPWIPKKEDLERSSLVERYDVTIRPEHRGKDKLGGALVSLPSRSTQSRTHNPLPPSVAASIEFDRERRRIQLIAELRGLVDKKELTETEAVLRKKEYDSEVEIRKYGKKNANKKPKDGVRRYSSEASIASSSINVDETYKVDNMKGELADGDESNKSASDAHSLTRSQTVPITNSEPAVESILEQNGDEIPQPESELESELLTQTTATKTIPTTNNDDNINFTKSISLKKDKLKEIETKMKEINEKERHARAHTIHVMKDQDAILELKSSQRFLDGKERSVV